MDRLLETYLQDHHAGSVAGVAAFERIAASHGDEHVRQGVAAIGEQVKEDQKLLEDLMTAAGAKPSRVKNAGAAVGEKLGRLKPNERVVSRSPLSDLLELEALVAAVHTKMLGWVTLFHLDDPALSKDALQGLINRANEQEARLEELRLSQVHKLQEG